MVEIRVAVVATSLAVLLGATTYALAHDHDTEYLPVPPTFDRQETTVRWDGVLTTCTVQGVTDEQRVVSITFIDCEVPG